MSERLSNKCRLYIEQEVRKILDTDDSGHGFDHVERVRGMSMDFADYYPEVDRRVIELAALLHDVDDYKLVGREQSELQTNATRVMANANLPQSVQDRVKEIIATMGYSKALRGIRPVSLEGMVVSDADMCDAMGAIGLIRNLTYAVSTKGDGVVFNPDAWPHVDITAEQYNQHGTTHDNDSFVNHLFERQLKLRGMMLTVPGQEEAIVRDTRTTEFMRGYFIEHDRPEWLSFLETYLEQRSLA